MTMWLRTMRCVPFAVAPYRDGLAQIVFETFSVPATYASIETLRSVCLLGRTLAIFMEL